MGRQHRRVAGRRVRDTVLIGVASALFAVGLLMTMLVTVRGSS